MDRLTRDLRLIRSVRPPAASESASFPILLAFEISTDVQHNKEQSGEFPNSCPILASVKPDARKIRHGAEGKPPLLTAESNLTSAEGIRPLKVASFWHREYQPWKRGTKPSARPKGSIAASFSVNIQSSGTIGLERCNWGVSLAAGGARGFSVSLRTVGAGRSAVDRNGEAATYLDIIAGIRRGDRRNKLAYDPGILNPVGYLDGPRSLYEVGVQFRPHLRRWKHFHRR